MPQNVTRRLHPLRARRLVVRRIEPLTSRMARIVLGGDDLEADFPFPPFAFADHVKLLLPDERTGELALPAIVDDRVVQTEGPPALRRDYTIRSVDRVAHEIALDFVLHAHGPAGRWAMRAVIGDEVGILGPRGSVCFPADYDRYLFVADETAQPAVARAIDDLGGRPATVIGISTTPAEVGPLAELSGITLISLVLPIAVDRGSALTA